MNETYQERHVSALLLALRTSIQIPASDVPNLVWTEYAEKISAIMYVGAVAYEDGDMNAFIASANILFALGYLAHKNG